VGKKDFQATNLVVQAHAFTQAARQAIEEQGGTCQILSKTTHKRQTSKTRNETKAKTLFMEHETKRRIRNHVLN
jgi:hypothetical protein